MEARNIVLKNSEGKVIRSLHWDSEIGHIVRLKDSGRLQVVASTKPLLNEGIEFELIKANISKAYVTTRGLSLGAYGQLAPVSDKDKFAKDITLNEDHSDNSFQKTLHKTAAVHVIAVVLLFLLSWTVTQFFSKDKELPVKVTQKEINEIRKEHEVTVNVSQKKIKKQPRYAKKKTNIKVAKVTQNKRITKSKPTRKKSTHSPVQVSQMGALGVLGGKVTGSKDSAGAWASTNAKRGSGLSQNSLKGGAGNSLPGQGLVSSPRGNSGSGVGAGGYATRGRGGGKQGYGKMDSGGSSSAYSEPLTEEALIEGGLDRDQIASVINRNIGQIIYCYEQGLQTQPALAGRVNVRFVIGGTGRVKTAQVANTSLGSKTVESCIVNKLSGWKFPKPYGSVNVNVTYPFVLKRVSQR